LEGVGGTTASSGWLLKRLIVFDYNGLRKWSVGKPQAIFYLNIKGFLIKIETPILSIDLMGHRVPSNQKKYFGKFRF